MTVFRINIVFYLHAPLKDLLKDFKEVGKWKTRKY